MNENTWMKGWKADPGCRSCDGHGIYFGNICPCHCLSSEETGEKANPEQFEELCYKYEQEEER